MQIADESTKLRSLLCQRDLESTELARVVERALKVRSALPDGGVLLGTVSTLRYCEYVRSRCDRRCPSSPTPPVARGTYPQGDILFSKSFRSCMPSPRLACYRAARRSPLYRSDRNVERSIGANTAAN